MNNRRSLTLFLTLSTIALALPAIAQPTPNIGTPSQQGGSPSNPRLLPPRPIPNATITPTAGRIAITLVNGTGTGVVYQAFGQTEPRTLFGRSQTSLDLNAPANLNFYRPDRGNLLVNLRRTAPDAIEVTLTESADPLRGRSSMVVNPAGEIYIY